MPPPAARRDAFAGEVSGAATVMRGPIFYDIQASFAPGSDGAAMQRLVDKYGEAQLGVKAWELGRRAYVLLSESNPSCVISNKYVAEVAALCEGASDEFISNLAEESKSGRVEIQVGETPLHESDWREASWVWKLHVVIEFLKGFPEIDQHEIAKGFGVFMVSAALQRLDNAVVSSFDGAGDGVTDSIMEAAWFVDHVESNLKLARVVNEQVLKFDRERATARARRRHELDPKSKAKEFVRECWNDWQQTPNQYESASAFARAMLDKFPDTLTSEVVVTRWVRLWKVGTK